MKNTAGDNSTMSKLRKIFEDLPPKRMKNPYKGVFYGLILCAIILGNCSQAERLIQILTGLAVAITALIAVSSAEPKKDRVEAAVRVYVTPKIKDWKREYPVDELKDGVGEFFAQCPVPITSYKVQFEITNTSSFDWVNPVVTFWLPPEKRHPKKDKEEDTVYSTLGYHSNTYNVSTDVRTLEMVDGVVISNRNLPYWRQRKHLTIWIKMVLSNKGSEAFTVDVSVDSENADGFPATVTVDPKKLIADIEQNETETPA